MNFPKPENVSPIFRLFFQSACAVSLSFYFYILFVIIKHFKQIGRAYHILAFSMAPIDILTLVITSLWVFIHRWATTEPQKMALFAFVGYVSQGTALNQLALAISRFTAIVFFSKISKSFEWWLTVGLFTSCNLLCVTWTVAYCVDIVFIPIYSNHSLVFCVVTAITMYGSCFFYLSAMRKNSRIRSLKKRELRILFQSAILCFNQVLVIVFFSISADGSAFASYGAQISSLLNFGGNPFIYVAFSTELRCKAFPFLNKSDDNKLKWNRARGCSSDRCATILARSSCQSDTDGGFCDLLESVV